MKTFIPFIAAVLIFASCNNKAGTAETNSDTTITNEAATPGSDSAAIRQTITSFYDWYKINFMRFPTTGLYKSIKTADMPPYKIDWAAVEKYHRFIKDLVPQLGTAFIEEQKKFFAQCDSAFKKDTDGEIPYGFDYDWYTNSQEDPDYLIDEMKNSHNWKTTVNGDEATVEIMRWREQDGTKTEEVIIKFIMKREAGKWTIARIGGVY